MPYVRDGRPDRRWKSNIDHSSGRKRATAKTLKISETLKDEKHWEGDEEGAKRPIRRPFRANIPHSLLQLLAVFGDLSSSPEEVESYVLTP
uniref:Uncharacterized protein n=1 Tax=Steinernema glaseri TaxID=37863 RepID=A0A1I7Z863_9BILA